jgi:hypothetical protein
MTKRLARVPQALARLGVGKTRFYELVNEGRLALVNLGPGSVAAVEDDDKSPGSIDALIDELIAAGHKPKVVPVRPKAKSNRKKQRA